MRAPVLRVRNLTVVNRQGIRLVDRVSFDLSAGEMLGLVGESGSGKTVTCRALLRLLPGEGLVQESGEVWLGQTDIMTLDDRRMSAVRGHRLGMIFQNPASHLNPVMTIGEQIAESRRRFFGAGGRESREKAVDLLRQVGIPDPQRRVNHYPHEFSGGMRQRAMIAVALSCEPQILIADEPTTALDVTVQVQILRLLMDLRDRLGLAIIMITHDLGIVAQTCDRIAVMYGGRLCEVGAKRSVLSRPLHPYTRGLIDCQPTGTGGDGRLNTIVGQPPSANNFPQGCRFHPRCPRSVSACRTEQPPLLPMRDDAGHQAACHMPFYPLTRWEE
ncbi:ABC transporter ATP-binding protein [Sodalis ligni]|uniref:ABC transporter ATP-binding protein n=1 Tax=Sodalis ligni TaxID=2697027 RepID=UPI00193FAEE9|nr:ABC transporter ATP-binding protein [Sodalis ligni]QWA09611.1 ABC transporter ATP-binding protein [Sodalis ligni]